MIIRAAAVWLLLLVIAVGAGTLRTALLEPRIGERAAHIIGTLLVAAIIAAVIWATAGWLSPARNRAELLAVGVSWVAATVLFELGFGHYVMGHSWARLLADYNLLAGRLWLLVLLTLLLMPVIAGELQKRAQG